jgi:hypothetical protein
MHSERVSYATVAALPNIRTSSTVGEQRIYQHLLMPCSTTP